MKFLVCIGKAIDGLSKLAAIIGAGLMLPLIGSLNYEIVSRYFYNKPTAWAYEMSYMFMGSMFLLGMAYTLKVRQHVNVDILYNAFSRRGRGLADFIGLTVLLIATASMSYVLFDHAWEAYEFQETSGASGWNPVIWPFRAVWFVGFLVLALQTAAEWARAIGAMFEKPCQFSGSELNNRDKT